MKLKKEASKSFTEDLTGLQGVITVSTNVTFVYYKAVTVNHKLKRCIKL